MNGEMTQQIVPMLRCCVNMLQHRWQTVRRKVARADKHRQPVRAIDAGLQSQQWGRKKAAALAAARLAEDGADPLRPHALRLLDALLTEVSTAARPLAAHTLRVA